MSKANKTEKNRTEELRREFGKWLELKGLKIRPVCEQRIKTMTYHGIYFWLKKHGQGINYETALELLDLMKNDPIPTEVLEEAKLAEEEKQKPPPLPPEVAGLPIGFVCA